MATLPKRVISPWSNKRPSAKLHSRASKKSLYTPLIVVDQLVFPNTTWALLLVIDAAIATSGISIKIALASASVSVCAFPKPKRAPAWIIDPGIMISKLEPKLAICSCSLFCAPPPIAIMAITAATPITMPSIVKIDLSLLTCNARIAMAKFIVDPIMTGTPSFQEMVD